jgi:dipeptidyl aminopeptidase/acylaminoacyl peptidase
VTAPHDFVAAVGSPFMLDAQALAQLGFVVVVLDGRGSALRGKAFQDYLYNNMQEFAIEDHVTAIRQLASTRPYMDIDRVGIYGHSFGGYAAMKAILGYPDFFKVAASSAAPYDLYGIWSLEAFFEPPIFADGASHPSGPTDRPANWGDIDLTQQAGRLKGKLLLAYGDLDENSFPAVAARMVSALIAANKSFELIYIPNGGHGFSGGSYFIRRRWDFFVRNLLGVEPPADYQMGSN